MTIDQLLAELEAMLAARRERKMGDYKVMRRGTTMTTNKPPIAAWAPGTALAKLASRRNNSSCVLTDGPAEFNDVPLIRLSDYERLEAECDLLRKHLQNLIDQTTPLEPVPGNPMWSRRIQLDEVIAERDSLRAECDKLQADYEEVLADHRRLARELDVLLNGEEGAARQASLADLVAQLRTVVRNTEKPVLAAPDVDVLVARLSKVISELESGFVACERCGDQEDTATLDCMPELTAIRNALAALAAMQGDQP